MHTRITSLHEGNIWRFQSIIATPACLGGIPASWWWECVVKKILDLMDENQGRATGNR